MGTSVKLLPDKFLWKETRLIGNIEHFFIVINDCSKLISNELTRWKHSSKVQEAAVGGSSSSSACLLAVCIWLRLSPVKELPGYTVERMRPGCFPLRRLLLVTPARYTAAVQPHRSWSSSHGTLL